MSSPAPRIAPRAAQPGRPLPHDLRRQHRPTRPRPPPPARGSRRPERSRPGDGRGAPRSADRHRAACRAPGGDGCWGERCGQGRPGARCSAAGPGRHVPRRRRVQRRSTRHKLEEKAERSFPAQRPAAAKLRQLLRRSATTPSGPAGDFLLLQGARGIAQGKWPRTRAADFPPSLAGKRKAPLGVPETLDYPHRADPAPPLPPHSRAGTGRRPQQSARGGKGAPPPRSPPHSRPPRNSSSRRPPPLSPPPFPLRLVDEPRALPEPAFPFGPRRAGEPRSPGNRRVAARPAWGSEHSGAGGLGRAGWGRGGNVGASRKDSLPPTKSLQLSRASWRIWFIWFPASWSKNVKPPTVWSPPLAHRLAKPPTPLRAVPGALSRCALTAVFPPANG